MAKVSSERLIFNIILLAKHTNVSGIVENSQIFKMFRVQCHNHTFSLAGGGGASCGKASFISWGGWGGGGGGGWAFKRQGTLWGVVIK